MYEAKKLLHHDNEEKLYSRYKNKKFDVREKYIASYYIHLYDTMPSFYGKHLSATIQEAVETQLNLAVEDQLNLFEELAIIRKFACDALDLYKQAAENPDSKPIDKLATSKYAVSALELVTSFCEKAAKVDSMQRDKYSIHTINSIVAQIVNIIYIVLEMDAGRPDLAKLVEKTIREQLKVPVQTVKLIDVKATESEQERLGTNLTPNKLDQLVTQMDSSIPGTPNVPNK